MFAGHEDSGVLHGEEINIAFEKFFDNSCCVSKRVTKRKRLIK